MRKKESNSETVKVSAPSGYVFEFFKPTLFRMAIRGAVPEYYAAEVLEAWGSQGVHIPQSAGRAIENDFEDDTEDIIQILKLEIAELSCSPKIRINDADYTKNEIFIDEVALDDLLFLLVWVGSGGSQIAKLSKLIKNSKKMLWIARMSQRFSCRPSVFYNFANFLDEITCASFDLFCDMRMIFYEAEQWKEKAKLDWQTQVSANANEPLQFDDDSFSSAGIYQKHRKTEKIETDKAGRITDRQKAIWQSEGYEVW